MAIVNLNGQSSMCRGNETPNANLASGQGIFRMAKVYLFLAIVVCAAVTTHIALTWTSADFYSDMPKFIQNYQSLSRMANEVCDSETKRITQAMISAEVYSE